MGDASAISPADLLIEDMKWLGLSPSEFASGAEMSFADVTAIMAGHKRIDADAARKIAKMTGRSAQFWLEAEERFVEQSPESILDWGQPWLESQSERAFSVRCLCEDITHDILMRVEKDGSISQMVIPAAAHVYLTPIGDLLESWFSNAPERRARARWSTMPAWLVDILFILARLDAVPSFFRRLFTPVIPLDCETILEPKDTADRIAEALAASGVSFEIDEVEWGPQHKVWLINNLMSINIWRDMTPLETIRYLFGGFVQARLLVYLETDGGFGFCSPEIISFRLCRRHTIVVKGGSAEDEKGEKNA